MSPSINGWQIGASIGENLCSTTTTQTVDVVVQASDTGYTYAAPVITDSVTTCNSDRVTSVAAKGSIAGVSVAFGAVDQVGANDDSFVTLGYSIAGVGIGYGMYDSDVDETTAISVTSDLAGMTVGYRYDDLDATTDNNMSTYSIQKSLGAVSFTLLYEDQDTDDNSEWNLVYAMGF